MATPKVLPEAWALAGVSAEDAEFLINETLRLVVERGCHLDDLHFLADPKRIPVLATDAGSFVLKPIGDVSFEPVSESTLKERAEAHGSYVFYFRFWKIAREGSAIVVGIANVAQQAANLRPPLLAGSSLTIEFSRQNGQWVHICGPSSIS